MRKIMCSSLLRGMLFISGFALLIFVGRHVFATPNAAHGTDSQTEDRASERAVSLEDGAVHLPEGAPEDVPYWDHAEPGAKIALGNNANAVLSLDLIADGGSGNRRDDGVTTGAVSGRGTKIAVEVFATGVRTSLAGMVIKFDFDPSLLALVRAENSAFPLTVPDGSIGTNFAATSPVTLPSSGFLARAEFETVADVAGRQFSIGIASVTLAESSTSRDEVTTASEIRFNAGRSPDFDGDGTVGFSDFLALAGAFGSQRGDAAYEARYDLDGDGTIGFGDFLTFAGAFGSQVPPSGGGGGGSGDIVIVSGPTFVSNPSIDSNRDGKADTYGPNEIIRIRVELSAQVCGYGSLGLTFQTGAGASVVKNADYCGCGGDRYFVYFCYQVNKDDIDGDGLSIAANSVSLRSYDGDVPDTSHDVVPPQAGHKVDGSLADKDPPRIDTPGHIFGTPSVGDTYRRGERIWLAIRFTEAVVVDASGGVPTLGVEIGREVRGAQYVAEASDSDRLVFSYVVQAGDRDDDGRIWVPAGSLMVPAGSSIKDVAGNDALLSWSVSSGSHYYVDGRSSSSQPDLVVQSPSVSNTNPNAGESFTLRATVRNAGGAASASTTLRYYRSSDAAISTSDTEVGTDAVGALDASGTSDESIGLNAPSSAGEYYYGACVESVSEESETGNNCSGGVRVTVTASNGGSGGNLGKCAVGMVVKPNQRCSVGSAEFINIGGGCYQFTAFGTGRICGSGFNLNGLRGTRSGSDFRITAVP